MRSAKRNKVGAASVSRLKLSHGVQGRPNRTRALRRPFVAAIFAMTVDGKITTRNFSPVDFTSREDRQHLFRQRALADAVLLGLPQADLRETRIKRGQTPYPIRVIVSNQGKIDSRLKIFQSDISPIIIFSTKRMLRKHQQALREKATLYLSDTQHVDLAAMLRTLRDKYKIRTVACEGGPTLFRALLERGLIDQLNLTIAPYMFGGANAPTLTGLSKEFLPASVHCSLIDMRVIGDECFLTYRIKHKRHRSAEQRHPRRTG